ncbi:hypothetical protein V8G54_003099 [Vigna mungo]|uniref:Uncharacterized protein n=1 Tax=Vigna mungo TaxID=3915 RepID=A0AAQ3P9W4_VIGMU
MPKDPTGTTKASLHKKVLKDPNFGAHIGLGCVRTFSAFPPNYYVNIVLRNVIKVFVADICPPTKELMMETPKPVIRPLLLEEQNMDEIMRKLRNPHHQQPSTSKVTLNHLRMTVLMFTITPNLVWMTALVSDYSLPVSVTHALALVSDYSLCVSAYTGTGKAHSPSSSLQHLG